MSRRVASETRRLAAHSWLRGSLVSGVAKGSKESDININLADRMQKCEVYTRNRRA